MVSVISLTPLILFLTYSYGRFNAYAATQEYVSKSREFFRLEQKHRQETTIEVIGAIKLLKEFDITSDYYYREVSKATRAFFLSMVLYGLWGLVFGSIFLLLGVRRIFLAIIKAIQTKTYKRLKPSQMA